VPALALADEVGNDLLHVGERELVVRACRQDPAPGVEDHQRLGARSDLRIEIVRRRSRQLAEQPVQRLRITVEKRLGLREVAAAAALDHVGRDRPGRACEADERCAARKFAADQRHRIHHEAQLPAGVGHRERIDISRAAHRPLDARPFALLEREPDAHRLRDHQDVREEYRGVERIARKRLQRHLAGELRVGRQAKEAACLCARRAVLREVAARLAHEPHRRTIHRLARQRAQEPVIRQRGHLPGKIPAMVAWIDSAAARGSAASRIGRPTTM